MPTLSGNLSDFRIVNIASWQPVIKFTPSGPTVTLDSFLLSTEPVVAVLLSDGSWTAALTDSEQMSPVRSYRVSVEWLSPTGVPGAKDFGEWDLFMPAYDCTMRELVGLPSNPMQAWVGPTAPENPQVGTGWLNPNTGDYMEWE